MPIGKEMFVRLKQKQEEERRPVIERMQEFLSTHSDAAFTVLEIYGGLKGLDPGGSQVPPVAQAMNQLTLQHVRLSDILVSRVTREPTLYDEVEKALKALTERGEVTTDGLYYTTK